MPASSALFIRLAVLNERLFRPSRKTDGRRGWSRLSRASCFLHSSVTVRIVSGRHAVVRVMVVLHVLVFVASRRREFASSRCNGHQIEHVFPTLAIARSRERQTLQL